MTEQIIEPKTIVLERDNVLECMEWIDLEETRVSAESDPVKRCIGYLGIIKKLEQLIIDGRSV